MSTSGHDSPKNGNIVPTHLYLQHSFLEAKYGYKFEVMFQVQTAAFGPNVNGTNFAMRSREFPWHRIVFKPEHVIRHFIFGVGDELQALYTHQRKAHKRFLRRMVGSEFSDTWEATFITSISHFEARIVVGRFVKGNTGLIYVHHLEISRALCPRSSLAQSIEIDRFHYTLIRQPCSTSTMNSPIHHKHHGPKLLASPNTKLLANIKDSCRAD